MSAPSHPTPRSPEAVQLAAEAIVGALVMRVRSGTAIGLWTQLADRVPGQDGVTAQMALDHLVRGGWVDVKKVPGTTEYLVVLYLDGVPGA